jgi:tRNA threonylcarbamoyladenosine biosynthesis protein TsaB
MRDTLPAATAELLQRANITARELRAIVIGIGPGSFTGLRVGLAFAKGMARAANLPLWPLSSLKVFAANVAKEFEAVAAFSPARRGQAHMQIFNGNDLTAATPAQVVEYEKIGTLLPAKCTLVGPGIQKLPAELAENLKQFLSPESEQHRAHAEKMAKIALTEWPNKPALDPGDLVPEYGLEFGN